MTHFEKMLLDNGYIKFILNCKTMRFEEAKSHVISTMYNIDYRYFHKSDNVLKKIFIGKSLNENDFTINDRKGEIRFGLNESGKPPTLISPRPKIRVKRIKEGKEVVESEQNDDSMNIVLKDFSSEEIFRAMYDKDIVFKINLT